MYSLQRSNEARLSYDLYSHPGVHAVVSLYTTCNIGSCLPWHFWILTRDDLKDAGSGHRRNFIKSPVSIVHARHGDIRVHC